MLSYLHIPYAFNQAILKFPKEINGLISIIVPMYNTSELHLKEALDSVMAQTFENWEAILVDDGSTNATVEKICAEYAEKDSRFKYVRKSNEGTLLARKTGLENARGEFVANLDHDDAYNPQFLEKMFAKMKEEDYDFVWCGRNSNKKLNAEFSLNKLENCHKHRNFGSATCNKLIKRNVYAKVLFPQIHIVGAEDYIQLVQIIYHSKQAAYVPDVFSYWRLGHNSASNPKDATSRKNLSASYSQGAVILYTLMEQLFNASEAEAHITFIESFKHYFFLSKKDLAHYKIEYVENFAPAFLRGVKKSRNLKFFKKIVLILACKGFVLPFRFYHKMGAIHFKSSPLRSFFRKKKCRI